MNKQLSLTVLALALAGTPFASAGTEHSAVSPASHFTPVDGSRLVPSLYKAEAAAKGSRSIQAVEHVTVDSLLNAFSFYTQNALPFTYEPTTQTLAMIRRGAEDPVVVPGTNSSKDDIYISTSSDWGKTWPANKQYGPLRPENVKLGARYPSVFMVNNGGTLTFNYSFPLVVNPGATATEWAWGDVVEGVLEITSPDLPYSGVIKEVDSLGKKYKWGTDSKMTSADNNTTVVVGGVTRLLDPASENNAFAVRRIDLQAEDPLLPPFIPAQWFSGQFVEPTGGANPGSRTSSIAGLDHDGNGKIYLGIAGVFREGNTERYPLPAVSVSSDNGKTWSNFEACPAAVITAYTTNLVNTANAIADSSRLGFADGFVVTNTNQWSFVTSYFYKTADRPDSTKSHIVEVYKNNDQWGVRKIANASGLVWNFLADENDPTLPSASQLGNELQIVKTVDNKTLLVKWLDFVNYTIGTSTQSSSDMFVAARKVDGEWSSQPINITADPMLTKITWLPNLIPNDLQNIPLISIQSKPTAEETDPVEVNINIQRRIVGRTQYIQMAHFNAQQAVSVEETKSGIASLQLGNATPNPLGSEGTITFTLPSGGATTLELYNALGQKVQSLVNGYKGAGTHSVALHTHTLPVGTYYYTLKWNGETETRMLSVVR